MQIKQPWYRNNRTLAGALPFLIIFGAVAQMYFDGAAKLIAQVIAGCLLLGFAVLVSANARSKSQ